MHFKSTCGILPGRQVVPHGVDVFPSPPVRNVDDLVIFLFFEATKDVLTCSGMHFMQILLHYSSGTVILILAEIQQSWAIFSLDTDSYC